MYIPGDKLPLVQDLISSIYTIPLNEPMIQISAQKTCSILDAHYFGLVLFPDDKRAFPLLVTNNPPEFLPAYNEVYKEDFLTETLIGTGGECVLKRIPDWADSEHRNFLQTLDSIRPASDGMYIPIKTPEGVLQGYWALARAGIHNAPFSDSDVETFRFLAGFMSDAYKRSLRPVPEAEDVAYLDRDGAILKAGDRIRAALGDLVALGRIIANEKERHPLAIFISHYKYFVQNPYRVGIDRVDIHAFGRLYSFAFRILADKAADFTKPGSPYAAVSLLAAPQKCAPNKLAVQTDAAKRFIFTKRENEVLYGIYRGMQNKEIAQKMGVDESNVKRHTHNIYSKTGFRSRVELVLGLPRHENLTIVESSVSKMETIP
jgi:DNA-binding CsgD family transcriptional regulator